MNSRVQVLSFCYTQSSSLSVSLPNLLSSLPLDISSVSRVGHYNSNATGSPPFTHSPSVLVVSLISAGGCRWSAIIACCLFVMMMSISEVS